MVTIHGKTKRPGVGIAVAAVIDAQRGMGGVSQALVHEGIHALKAMLAPRDYPEAVVACDILALGMSIRIPGIRTIGIAAESDADVPGLEPEVPCVIGLPGLVQSISEGDIVIVDGNKGLVHIDPDLRTLVHYQEVEEREAAGHTVYVEAAHLLAKTPDGEPVRVYACVADEAGLVTALDQGADGILLDLATVDNWQSSTDDVLSTVLHAAVGKPIAFVADSGIEDCLRAAMLYAAPHQVTLLFPSEFFDTMVAQTNEFIELVMADVLDEDLEPPEVGFGVRARDDDAALLAPPTGSRTTFIELAGLDDGDGMVEAMVPLWTGSARPGQVILGLGRRSDAVTMVVRAGARAIAVEPDLVSDAKLAINSMGAEE